MEGHRMAFTIGTEIPQIVAEERVPSSLRRLAKKEPDGFAPRDHLEVIPAWHHGLAVGGRGTTAP